MRTFLLAITVFVLSSCYKTEYSGTLTENGKVLDCFYTAAQVTHTRTQTVRLGGNSYYDDDWETDYQGHRHRRHHNNNGPQVYYSDAVNEVPAKYGVMFECEHGTKFVIEGSKEKHKQLWQKMKKDSTVTIFYREIYHVDSKSGQKSLFDYDFLDAKIGVD